MKIAPTVCRYLLGVIFTVFGLNGFLHFLPLPPPSSVLAGQFMAAAFQSHFMVVIFAVQLIGGVLLLANRFVPLALVGLAAVLVNILNFHLTMDPGGIGAGVLATILWFVTAYSFRRNFHGLLAANAEPSTTYARGGATTGLPVS
jgi:putative oxidoreductase